MRRGRLHAISDPIGVDDVIEQVSEPGQLAPGHPLRGTRCVLCAAMIGGRPCRLVTLIDPREGACGCGAINTVTMTMCAEHGDGASIDWLELLPARWLLHHGPVTA